MHFDKLNLDITFQTLPTRKSREINRMFQEFVRPLQATGPNEFQTTDAEASEFLARVAHKILTEVYGQTLTLEQFEDATALPEISAFLKAQVEQNGPQDFLLKPLGSLITGMERMLGGINDIVIDHADKLLNQMRT